MKQIKKIIFALLLFMLAFGMTKIESNAAEIIIEDSANLLTTSQKEQLRGTMEAIAEYGGVAFITNPEYSDIGKASDFAKKKCREYFNGDSGTVLLIDMYNRRIEIYSTGYIYKKINKQRANTITDNTYTYATMQDYYGCANETFKEMAIILEGGRITSPLKYVSNLLLAFGISTTILYLILYFQRRGSYRIGKDVKIDDIYSNVTKNVIITRKKMVSRRKTKHVESSDSSGGYSGGGGGSSSGGGGGGGHSF